MWDRNNLKLWMKRPTDRYSEASKRLHVACRGEQRAAKQIPELRACEGGRGSSSAGAGRRRRENRRVSKLSGNEKKRKYLEEPAFVVQNEREKQADLHRMHPVRVPRRILACGESKDRFPSRDDRS